MALPLSREVHQLAREYGLFVYVQFAANWLRYCVGRRFLSVLFGTRYLVRLEERDRARRERVFNEKLAAIRARA